MSNLIVPSVPFSPIPHVSVPADALGLQPCLDPVKKSPAKIAPLEFVPTPKPILDTYVAAPSGRCSVKGCVFPLPHGRTECHYHELVRSEAVLFQSHQPSHLLSLKAPFGIPEEEIDNSRLQDRQRQAAEREAFILDEPA